MLLLTGCFMGTLATGSNTNDHSSSQLADWKKERGNGCESPTHPMVVLQRNKDATSGDICETGLSRD